MSGKPNRLPVVLLFVAVVLFLLVVFYEDNVETENEKDVPAVKVESVKEEPKTEKNDSETSKKCDKPEDEVEAPGPASAPAKKNSEEEESTFSDSDNESVDEDVIKEKKTTDDEGFVHGQILPHKGFEEALLKLPGIELRHAMEISNAIRFKVDLRYLKAGEDFKVKLSKDGEVEKFVYYPDIITFHILERDEKTGKLEYRAKILPTEKRYRIVEGPIETTLNQALIDRDDVTGTIRAVTNGILSCVVSFRTDARKGDKYRILIEDKYYNGQMVPGSKILYVSYEGRRAGFNEAYRYEDKDEKSAFNAHYTKDGKALIPNAMRLPVDRVHVTSPFGYRRHPVTGRRSFHNGVDYGGPTGSPIYAVAQGVVAEVSRTTYGGKKIVLKHADGTKTYYLHLHRQLVRQGQGVKPRQKIALMGRTGRVTGPHLHFGIKSPQGKWLNPLKKRMIATPKLKGKRYAAFKKQMKKTAALLKDTEKLQKWLRDYDLGPQPEDFYGKYDI
jgi:murein DD-endopeptidase MepM/ murein hydrolase activator NlpD